MPKPKYFWYSFVEECIRRYNKADNSPFLLHMKDAVNKALAQTENVVDGSGPDRIKAVELVLINQTHTAFGAALLLNISVKTIQRYIASFVYLTAVYAGFPALVPPGVLAIEVLTPSERNNRTLSALTPAGDAVCAWRRKNIRFGE